MCTFAAVWFRTGLFSKPYLTIHYNFAIKFLYLMTKKIICTLFFITLVVAGAFARPRGTRVPMGKKVYQYRIFLTDKDGSSFTLKHPEEFLSKRSLERRARQGIAVDESDLPVSPAYLMTLSKMGLNIMGKSKWHNTVWVQSATDDVAIRLKGLKFVKDVVRVYASPDSFLQVPHTALKDSMRTDSFAKGRYGEACNQISQLNGIRLHEAGFRGQGKLIAVMDGGFHNADRIKALRRVRIQTTADFAPRRVHSIFADTYHGTMVLSCMAANSPDTMIGTAPDADFVLIRTEDGTAETHAEEDSWTAGAEFADSIGADIINTSLGYHKFDGDSTSYRYRDLDGMTAFVSQTASMLASKGIILTNSAGNEGEEVWHKIGVPADARDILAVGALNRKGMNTWFSSVGPSQDGRVKPDVCAMGGQTTVIDGSGSMTKANGTSFASPVMCGMVASLWSALPKLSARQIMSLIRRSADRYNYPDNVFGYGIPDFWKAYEMGRSE